VWHPLKGRNDAKWDPESPGAKRFMEVTEAAAAATDPDERKQLYFEAEKILCVDDAAQIPIYYYTRLGMTKPYLERTFDLAGGNEEIWTWKVKAH
ncbi:MAG: hypothetical protein JSW37_05720, partial [Anaerolineales bacterium]